MSKPLHEFPSDASWLLDLAWRLRNVPVTHGVDGFDIDCLGDIARRLALTSPQLHQHGGGVALDDLLDEYFSIGVREGREKRDHDDAMRSAEITREKIRAAFNADRTYPAALAQQPLSVTEGWQLVPIDPTEAMIEAWQQSIDSNSGFNLRVWTPEANAPFECWKSMLTAAPAHPTQSDVSCSRAREGGTEE